MIPGSVAFVAAAAAALVALPDVAPVVSAYESAALLPINSNILRNNMLYWTRDYAVMFYTPWCVECRQTYLPIWDLVAHTLALEDPKNKKKMLVTTFNCEEDDEAKEFCAEIGLERFGDYPRFFFYGSGKFHDHDRLTGMFRKPPTAHESSVLFSPRAPLYAEVLYDWVKTMNVISGGNRLMRWVNPFSWDRRSSMEKQLAEEMAALQDEALDWVPPPPDPLLYGAGDAYQHLALSTTPGSYESELEVCIMDLVEKYCQLAGIKEKEPFCTTVEACAGELDFRHDMCWPDHCPMQKEGCELVSACLTPTVHEMYKDALEAREGDERISLLTVTKTPVSKDLD